MKFLKNSFEIPIEENKDYFRMITESVEINYENFINLVEKNEIKKALPFLNFGFGKKWDVKYYQSHFLKKPCVYLTLNDSQYIFI